MKYLIHETQSYRKSYKRLVRSNKFPLSELSAVIDTLAAGKTLPVKYRNHKLSGNLKGCYECHVKPDLLLIYQVVEDQLALILVNLGRHADLFNM